MKKGLMINDKRMGKYEIEQGYASYRTIVNYYIEDLVLCNKITEIDETIYDNMENGCYYYDYETNEYKTQEEYENDTTGNIEMQYEEIYQWYLCNLTEWEKGELLRCGLILSYSDLLDCDVLCVNHCGTSWDYVLTDVKLFDTWEELEAYEKEDKNNEN